MTVCSGFYINAEGHNCGIFCRGAELINRILIKEVKKQKADESKLLENIKAKMNQLKEKQRHLKENFIEPEDHFAGIVFIQL